MNDQCLWDAFCANPCESTFRALYEETHALVWTLCRRVLHSDEDASDAFQAVYCRLLATARGALDASLPPYPRLIYWLALREANNLRMARWRRSRKEVSMESYPVTAAEDPTARELAEQGQMRERIEALIAALPERDRLPLQLHYFHGLTHEQIGAALGAPPSTISNRIVRARRKLEPLLRRAGLSGATLLAILMSCEAQAKLWTPPATLGAELVFKRAAKLLASQMLTHQTVVSHTLVSRAGDAALVLLGTLKANLLPLALLMIIGASGVIGVRQVMAVRPDFTLPLIQNREADAAARAGHPLCPLHAPPEQAAQADKTKDKAHL